MKPHHIFFVSIFVTHYHFSPAMDVKQAQLAISPTGPKLYKWQEVKSLQKLCIACVIKNNIPYKNEDTVTDIVKRAIKRQILWNNPSYEYTHAPYTKTSCPIDTRKEHRLLLINLGVDVDACINRIQYTTIVSDYEITCASERLDWTMIETLIAHGANPNRQIAAGAIRQLTPCMLRPWSTTLS